MDETSGVKGDFHAPFCGSPGVRFPRATRRVQTRTRQCFGCGLAQTTLLTSNRLRSRVLYGPE
jgi:hypothetical protein